MSLFKKIMAGIGIGATQVDLILPKKDFSQGETLTGTLVIESGDVDQDVDEIYLNLIAETRDEDERRVRTVDTRKVAGGICVQAGQSRQELSFTYQIPRGIPITSPSCKYHFELGLDIKNAIDPKDVEHVVILPAPEVECVLGALQSLGFRHKYDSGEMEGALQKFEFVPTSFMRGKLDELEVSFRFGNQGLVLYMEVDKKGRGLFGALTESLELDERHVQLTIPYHQLLDQGQPRTKEVAQLLSEFIEREYNKII